MLDLLNNKNNNDNYVTRDEFEQFLEQLRSHKYIKGEPGKDAEITKDLIDKIKKMVTPVKGVHYKDGISGIDGRDYILTTEDKKDIADMTLSGMRSLDPNEYLDGEGILKMIKSVQGENRLVVDNIKGFKKYIQRINELTTGYTNLYESVNSGNEELLFVKKKLDLITIDIANPGSADGVLTKAEINCTTKVLTLTTEKKGVETPINVDLSCLSPKHVCHDFEPTTEGLAEGFIDGSHWYYESTDGNDKALFTFMCNKWIKTCVCDCYYVTQEGDADIITEEGDCVIWQED